MNFETWGMTGTLVTEDEQHQRVAAARLWHWIGAIDSACNRFRFDSEISRLNAHPGEPLRVSTTFLLALDAAQRASDATSGLCDPTVLPALVALGYDQDYDALVRRSDVVAGDPVPARGMGAISVDRTNQTVALDEDCQLDLGATAKALVADLVAHDLCPLGGVLVELGGDLAARGTGPTGPWVVGIADSLRIHGAEPRVAVTNSAVATSSTTTRTWRASGAVVHHIIDPRTGQSARGPYATATVCAGDCVTANAFATAALVWGSDAPYFISQAGWSGRLVRHDGTVELVGRWPREEVRSS